MNEPTIQEFSELSNESAILLVQAKKSLPELPIVRGAAVQTWQAENEPLVSHENASAVRRVFDKTISLIFMALLSPTLAVVIILLRIEGPGVFVSFVSSPKSPCLIRGSKFRYGNILDGEVVPTTVGAVLRRTGFEMFPLLTGVIRGDFSLQQAFQAAKYYAGTLAVDIDVQQSRIVVAHSSSPEFASMFPLRGKRLFWTGKRAFDLVVSFLLLPALGATGLILLVLNPFLNRGSLFYVQTRMGKNCQPFRAIKFRSMDDIDTIKRGPDDPLEQHRVTILGSILRKCRLDELPQIFNVIKGQMSLIGPRPDYYRHAVVFLRTVPGYLDRHAVRPGISGLAQVELGYIEGTIGTIEKVKTDLTYIKHAGFRQEVEVVARTVKTVLTSVGA